MSLFSFLHQFDQEKKIGGQELILDFKQRLETNIESKYNDFKQDNETKKKQHEVSFFLFDQWISVQMLYPI